MSERSFPHIDLHISQLIQDVYTNNSKLVAQSRQEVQTPDGQEDELWVSNISPDEYSVSWGTETNTTVFVATDLRKNGSLEGVSEKVNGVWQGTIFQTPNEAPKKFPETRKLARDFYARLPQTIETMRKEQLAQIRINIDDQGIQTIVYQTLEEASLWSRPIR